MGALACEPRHREALGAACAFGGRDVRHDGRGVPAGTVDGCVVGAQLVTARAAARAIVAGSGPRELDASLCAAGDCGQIRDRTRNLVVLGGRFEQVRQGGDVGAIVLRHQREVVAGVGRKAIDDLLFPLACGFGLGGRDRCTARKVVSRQREGGVPQGVAACLARCAVVARCGPGEGEATQPHLGDGQVVHPPRGFVARARAGQVG